MQPEFVTFFIFQKNSGTLPPNPHPHKPSDHHFQQELYIFLLHEIFEPRLRKSRIQCSVAVKSCPEVLRKRNISLYISESSGLILGETKREKKKKKSQASKHPFWMWEIEARGIFFQIKNRYLILQP